MQIIITWQMIVFFFALYYTLKYLRETLLKCLTGCQDPFSPFYSYRDYPQWRKGYNRGWRDLGKEVKKLLAELQANLDKHPAQATQSAPPEKEPNA